MIKKLISVSFFVFTLFVVSNIVNAQSMYFCESVSKDGYPITESSTFNISSSGGYLNVLVRLPYEIGCRAMSFVIYRNGDYDNTINLDVERNWVWMYKEITFYKSGNYDIYAYDCNNVLLTSGALRINFK